MFYTLKFLTMDDFEAYNVLCRNFHPYGSRLVVYALFYRRGLQRTRNRLHLEHRYRYCLDYILARSVQITLKKFLGILISHILALFTKIKETILHSIDMV